MKKLMAVAALAAAALVASSTGNVHGNAFGNPKAPVLIEVFSDFQCPGCKAFHDNDLSHLMADYVNTGKVYLIYRYFPLPMHPHGRICSEYASAAARVNRYKEVSDALFAHQQEIAMNGNVDAALTAVLTPAELSKVKSLLKAEDVQKDIETDIAEGKAVPVPSTPTLWVT